jgi:hypothetical protein
MLTFVLVATAVVALGLFYFGQLESIQQNYNSEIGLSISRERESFDYSCDKPVYGLYLKITNTGQKVVNDLSVSITNPICAGSVPPIIPQLLPLQSQGIYVYSTAQNGTLTISGNNTMIFLKF